MSYTKKTLLDLQQYLADKHDSGSLPTDSSTLAYWTRLLNNAQDYIADRLKLVKSTDLTTVSGIIALPDDFISIKSVIVDDEIELAQIDKEDSGGVTGNVFWITGNHYDGFSLNTPNDDDYEVFYVYNIDPLVNTTDICIIPDPITVAIYAYAKLRQAETDPLEDANQSLGEAEARIRSMIENRVTNDGDLSFTLNENA